MEPKTPTPEDLDAVRLVATAAEAPEALAAPAKALFDAAHAQGADLALVIVPDAANQRRALTKRRHDLKAAGRTLGLAIQALESGYRFDDDKARAKIDAIAKAVQVLTRETDLVLRALEAAEKP